MDDPKRLEKFREVLKSKVEWPSHYPFKFIVPSDQYDLLCQLLPDVDLESRFSQGGKYTSVSFSLHCEDENAVIDIYVKVSEVNGLIAL